MIPNVTFQGPITITKGGRYQGNYRSTDPNVHPVQINTNEPVELLGCIITGVGQEMIMCYGGHRVTIHYCQIYGQKPFYPDQQFAHAANSWGGEWFVFENNYMEDTGGVLVQDFRGGEEGSVQVNNNNGLNCLRTKGDGTPGQFRAFIQLNNVRVPGAEIAWNRLRNEPGKSHVEDVINIYDSGGFEGKELIIHDNLVHGAYPKDIFSTFHGSGITVDISGDAARPSKHIKAYGNYVIGTSNAAMNIAGGTNVSFYDNVMVNAAVTPDGQRLNNVWAGCCIFNYRNLPAASFNNLSITGNTIGFVHWGGNFPYPDRQDEMDNRSTNITHTGSNQMPAGKNKYLPQPITLATEAAYVKEWEDKVKAHGVVIGHEGEVEEPPTDPVETDLTIRIGLKATVTINPLNAAGSMVGYKSGSIKAVSSNPAVVIATTSGKTVTLGGVSVGTATITLSLKAANGTAVTRTLAVEVKDGVMLDKQAASIGVNVVVK